MSFNYKNLGNAHLLVIFEEIINDFERGTKDLNQVNEQYEKAKREILRRMEETKWNGFKLMI